MNRGESPGVPSVLVFGGTTEGRELAEWLSARKTCRVVVSSLTEYGGSLVADLPRVESLTGALPPERIAELLQQRRFACVVDATHPYAAGISISIAEAADACGAPVLRVLREGQPRGPWTSAASAQEAACIAAQHGGNVLLTCGTNDLPAFVAAMADFRERLFARVLPVARSIAATEAAGIPASHVVAMQGPFSEELNCALIRQLGITMLVTKASGALGGFWEKVSAAEACGIRLVVIDRPLEEEGMSIDEAKAMLEDVYGL